MSQNLRQAQHAARARLQRALDSMTVGFERDRARVEAETAPLRPGDMVHSVQMPVSGEAGGLASSFDVTAMWADTPFLTRLQVDEEDSEPVNPQFSFGYELQSDANVMMTACVREWLLDDRGLIEAARVRIMAVAPGATVLVPFIGVAHLTFIGYAAPMDDDDDGTATTPGGDWPSGGTDNVTAGFGWGGTGG